MVAMDAEAHPSPPSPGRSTVPGLITAAILFALAGASLSFAWIHHGYPTPWNTGYGFNGGDPATRAYVANVDGAHLQATGPGARQRMRTWLRDTEARLWFWRANRVFSFGGIILAVAGVAVAILSMVRSRKGVAPALHPST